MSIKKRGGYPTQHNSAACGPLVRAMRYGAHAITAVHGSLCSAGYMWSLGAGSSYMWPIGAGSRMRYGACQNVPHNHIGGMLHAPHNTGEEDLWRGDWNYTAWMGHSIDTIRLRRLHG